MVLRNEVAGAGRFLADRRVEALLLGEARRRAVTRVFGIPGQEQSLLVTMILAGSAATAIGGLVARPVLPHPSGSDMAIGGAVVNTAFGAMTGATRTAPLAGVLISFAVIAHALRPVLVGSAHEARTVMHRLRLAYDRQYAS